MKNIISMIICFLFSGCVSSGSLDELISKDNANKKQMFKCGHMYATSNQMLTVEEAVKVSSIQAMSTLAGACAQPDCFINPNNKCFRMEIWSQGVDKDGGHALAVRYFTDENYFTEYRKIIDNKDGTYQLFYITEEEKIRIENYHNRGK